jgi:hypothetical protein
MRRSDRSPRSWPSRTVAALGLLGTVLASGSPADAVSFVGDACSPDVDVSADGRYVAFDYTASLVTADTNTVCDVYVLDTTSGAVELVSRGAGGVGDADSARPSISNNGRYVAFESDATNLVAGDASNHRDIFLRDRTARATTLVSRTAAGSAGDAGSFNPDVSGNGAFVAFETDATTLIGATNGHRQIALWKRSSGALSRVSTSQGHPIAGTNVEPSVDDNGSHVGFRTDAAGLAPTGLHAAIIRDLTGPTTKALHPTCHVTDTPCLPDVSAGPELDGDAGRAVVGFSEPSVPFSFETAAMLRVSDSTELFAIDDLFDARFVAISRDGRVITGSDGQGDFLDFVGSRGHECIDDPDNLGDLSLTGNGGAVAYVEFGSDPLLQKLHFADGRCIRS